MQDRLAKSHSHSHAHDSRYLGWALLITGTFMIVEVVGGWLSGSLALLADAGHMLTDTGALALAWLAARLTARPTSPHRSYGYHRAQVLSAFVNALALIAVVLWIVIEALQRLATPRVIAGKTMLVIAVLGLLVNIAVYLVLRRGNSDNLNVNAARLHVLSDLLGSVSAATAAIVILTTGWTPIDALLSLLVAGLILRGALPLLRDSTHILMEAAPGNVDPDKLREALLAALPGVRDVHDVHCWSLTTGKTMLSLHLGLADGADADAVLFEAKRIIADRFEIEHSAVQLEYGSCPDSD